MSEIKPIQTRYKGYHFRSRLEARYAVFFDALGIKWEYEKEGYDLGEHGYYLPDFFLPDYNRYVEIKPTLPDLEEPGVFLAGPICNENWRFDVARELKYSMAIIGDICSYKSHDMRTVEILDCNFKSISKCDIFVAYLFKLDTPGTLIELGYAKALGKTIYVFLSPEFKDPDDDWCDGGSFWFAEKAADFVYVIDNPKKIGTRLTIDYPMPTEYKKCVALSEALGNIVTIMGGTPGEPDFNFNDLGMPNCKSAWFIDIIKFGSQDYYNAANRFKSARFEHGQCG